MVGKHNFGHLEIQIGYRFHNPNLLEKARTSAAYANENPGSPFWGTLATLGDAVLKPIIVEQLMDKCQTQKDITVEKQRKESRKKLALIANDLEIFDCLNLGIGEKSSGTNHTNALGESLEAIIGAIFLDSDYNHCKKVVLSWRMFHEEFIDNVP
jgi:ribonuclease-3